MTLESVLVRDIMVPAITLSGHALARSVRPSQVPYEESLAPVVDSEQRLLGLLQIDDLIAAHQEEKQTPELQIPLHSILVPVATARCDTTLRTALECMLQGTLRLLPVVDSQNLLLGVVTMDIMLSICETWAQQRNDPLSLVMTRSLVTARSDIHVLDALQLLAESGVEHLPIVDDLGHLESVVNRRSLTAYLKTSAVTTSKEIPSIQRAKREGSRFRAVTRSASMLEAVRAMRNNRFGCLPVVEEEHLLGLITETDLLTALFESMRQPVPQTLVALVGDYMRSNALTIAPTAPAAQFLSLSEAQGVSTMLVASEGSASGVISHSDLFHSIHIPRFGAPVTAFHEFLNIPVSRFMSQPVCTVEEKSDVHDAIRALAHNELHTLVVVQQGQYVGSFGSSELYRAASDLQNEAILADIMTNIIFEIDGNETLRSGFRFLENAGIRSAIVRENGKPVGIFGQHEALRAASLPSLDQPIVHSMSSRFLCRPADTPCTRAAQQADELGVEQIVVTLAGETCGLVSASDFLQLFPLTKTKLDKTHGN